MAEAKSIAVIGAGLMGHAIAHVLAAAGHTVRVYDHAGSALDSLPHRLQNIADDLQVENHFQSRITAHTTLADAAHQADFVIEAVAENLAIKRKIVQQLESIIERDSIIASNTSALPITQIASEAKHADRIVGTHFWNPPHLVKLVEVTQAERTSTTTIEQTIALLSAAGHTAVHVKKDMPGFIGNRLQHALKREAIALVASGVCDAATVDDVVKHGFGKRLAVLGPLEQTDLVGLPLTKNIHETLMPALDTTQVPHPYMEELIARGHFGMSSGRGFYEWTDESAAVVRQRLNDYLKDKQ